MSPMSWMSLMIMFIISIMVVNSMMYFNKKYTAKNKKSEKTQSMINWKW
uniref:Cytochrome c oxidase polypeptide II n=1 Tax=Limnogonus hypoleucus TaxID=913167 RepID=A0A5B9XXN8_9HEMI|nr:ATPase subunit 8 [Limnogonus hypoleucus]QEH58879.1 ATPase subunit 8 [Limnogonus hypoleucus]